MLLVTGVLLLCGSLLSLAWAYEVNRREPLPGWARIELFWEMLLATAIGVAMVGVLLVLKYVLRLEGIASVDEVAVLGALVALAVTVALFWRIARRPRRLQVIEGGHDTPAAGKDRPARPGAPPRRAA